MFIKDMMAIAQEWINETPWLENYDLKSYTENWISQLKFNDNFGKVLENDLDWLVQNERNYLKCMRDIYIEGGEFFCLWYAANVGTPSPRPGNFFNFMNAFNGHPRIRFGYPLLHVANNSELAAKIGFAGFVVGHELSYSIIENPKKLEFFPIFSKPAIECVQDQYNATCNEYKEKNCGVRDNQIDENGADILGAQLAYKLLENYLGNALKDEYIHLNQITITYQQLFFYSAAFSFCEGSPVDGTDPHSAKNVRINALAQLPGFQDAFQCSPDSRIMKTVEKQCFIFGENAPTQR